MHIYCADEPICIITPVILGMQRYSVYKCYLLRYKIQATHRMQVTCWQYKYNQDTI